MKLPFLSFILRQPRWRLAAAAAVIIAAAIWVGKHQKSAETLVTFAAKRGDLDITVLEGGSIEALESQEIRSEVRGGSGTKILKIVDEGSVVTDDDVKKGKVLVELDSADIRDRIIQEEINYQSAVATLTDATQAYEIQRNQNTSNIKAADDKALFARMDLQKFLGEVSGSEVIALSKLDAMEKKARSLISGEDAEAQMIAAMEKTDLADQTNTAPAAASATNGNAGGAAVQLIPTVAPVEKRAESVDIDFSHYARPEALGDGSAQQDLRKLLDDRQTAEAQLSLATTKLAGTKRLFTNGFAAKTELDTDQISYDNSALKMKTAETAYNLFIKYEFPKQARDLVSKFEESLRALEREKKEAIAKLAQARAKLKGAESRFNLESNQRRDLLEQREKCVIRATRPGLVVYGGSSSDRYYDSSDQIREGATIRERQPIITIPNMEKMSVKVKIHESYIQKISKGLEAKIKVDAFPNEELRGEVMKVGLLPDSQNRWMNPDMKVYQTVVSINATNNWLKPGMSARVELMIKHLQNVICVPLQAVTELDGKHYCQVVNGRTEKREVEIGDYNDEFIEIKSGIKEGEKVSLHAAEAQVNRSEENEDTGDQPPDKSAVKPKAGKPAGAPAGPPEGATKERKPSPAGKVSLMMRPEAQTWICCIVESLNRYIVQGEEKFGTLSRNHAIGSGGFA